MATAVAPPETRSGVALVAATGATVVWGLAILPCLGALLMTVFMLDAPASGSDPFVSMVLAGVFGWPVLALAGVSGAWVAYARSHTEPGRATKLATAAALLPMASIALAGLGFLSIESVCDGRFSGR